MSVKILPRLSQDRGHANHGWLKTFHTFSFASSVSSLITSSPSAKHLNSPRYHQGEHDSFGCLRVINEDRVDPGTGFGTHGHREFEIFSYIISGEVEQCVASLNLLLPTALTTRARSRDSMGNVEVLKRGDLQMTSAGTGIRHSEHQHGPDPVHFLQIWATPSRRSLPPAYYTRHFPDAEKQDKWARVVAPAGADGVLDAREGAGPAPVHAPLELRAAVLSPGAALAHAVPSTPGARKAYVHVAQTSGYNAAAATGAEIKLSGAGAAVALREGDGAYVMAEPGAELKVENVGGVSAEVLLFDVDV
jgi:redox-sensitive bicupin YhaK (pirin superfamily)